MVIASNCPALSAYCDYSVVKLIFLLCLSFPVVADVANLSWIAPTTRTDGSTLDNLAGYNVKYGQGAGNYTNIVNINDPLITTYQVTDIYGEYCFVISAYDAYGQESVDSAEVCKVAIPSQPDVLFEWEVTSVPTRSTTGDGVKPTTYTFDSATAPWNNLNNGYIMEYTGTTAAPGTLTDFTGNGNTLTVNAGSIVEDGGIHGDLYNPGTNGASYNPGTEFDSLTDYSVVILFKVTTDTNLSGSIETFFRIAGSTAQDTCYLQWHVNENILFNAEDTDSGNTIQIANGIENNAGEYATIAGVIDSSGSGTQSLYVIVDGETTQSTSNATSGVTGSSNDNDTFTVGHGTVAFSSFDIEAVYFFDTALTQTQVEDIHTNPYSWNSGGAAATQVKQLAMMGMGK